MHVAALKRMGAHVQLKDRPRDPGVDHFSARRDGERPAGIGPPRAAG